MTWENAIIPTFFEDQRELEVVKLKAELEFWRNRAERYRKEFENAQDRLTETSKWELQVGNRCMHVILDPEYHSSKDD